ncbi:hypothetical protein ACFOWZ_20090 [Lentzea rhizosphaerae]|uniref:Membrane-associated oxidoreductase n=1 Tax=Lentzea rhizosphaerae TaxID=2041025 RepID=A0ABV8BWA0_9PSEU
MIESEQQLIEAAKNGDRFTGTTPDQVVRAEQLRELLLGHHGDLHPRGLRLEGVRIEGTLDLDSAKVVVGMLFTDCVFDGPILAYDAEIPHLMIIGGQLAGLYAGAARVRRELYLREGVKFAGGDDAVIRLHAAHIGGDLDLEGVEVTCTTGSAVKADSLRVDGSMFVRGGARITGHSELGAINMIGAHIGGKLELNDVQVRNNAGPAWDCEDVRVDGAVSARDNARFAGHGRFGGINLLNARISKYFSLYRGVEVTNSDGPALYLNGIDVTGSVFFRDGIELSGEGPRGAIDLIGAALHQEIEFKDVRITNTTGPALCMVRARVEVGVYLEKRVEFSGNDASGTVLLRDTHVGGAFGIRSADADVRIATGSGLVLDLRNTSVGTTVHLPPGLVCPENGISTTCENKRLVRLDEFTYGNLGEGTDWRQWLHLIRCHTPAYHASAYQRLAAVERAAGHDGTVRRILMAQQTDLRRRNPDALSNRLTRLFHWLWGVLAGYGYQARRTALALVLVLATAGVLGWWAGQVTTRPGHLAAERVTSSTSAAGIPCSTVELVGLGLDRGLPLAMTGMRTRCDLDTGTGWGQAFTAAVWLVQLAVWGLATLALAGYTNLVRKPS